jgi:hypothetical protein
VAQKGKTNQAKLIKNQSQNTEIEIDQPAKILRGFLVLLEVMGGQ